MRKNISLCRRVVSTSLLAIALVAVSSTGLNKVSADTGELITELKVFIENNKDKDKNDEAYKKAVASLSNEALNYLMLKVISDASFNNGGIDLDGDTNLNYLVNNGNKNKDARKIVFEEMKKRIAERGELKSVNKTLTDEVKYQQGRNSKLSAENRTLTEAMITHFKDLKKAEEEKAKLLQDLDKKNTDLKNLTKQFRLTLLKDESDKKKLETERDALKTKSDDL
ncbi:hypothetical protein, partial [Streptococcus canis]